MQEKREGRKDRKMEGENCYKENDVFGKILGRIDLSM